MGKIYLLVFSLFISIPTFAVPFKASQIAMTAHCPYAVRAGQNIAEKGGNAIDVALTLLITMAVTNPSFASLGGGGFALVKMKGPPTILDFREVAPEKTNRDYYASKGAKASVYGGAAVGVPGLPAGIFELHKKFGKTHWSRLFDEAIRLAEKGFRVTGEWSEDTKEISKNLNSHGKKYFLNQGKLYKAGELFKQPQLAKVLKLMRNRQGASFYQGDVARDIVNSVKAAGGDMSLNDLKNYKPIWREPLTEEFNGYKLYLMPPPSSGGLVIQQALRLSTLLNLQSEKPRSSEEAHKIGEILRRAYRGRVLLGDPEFHKNPTSFLMSDTYIKSLAKSFNADKASELSPLEESDITKESNETSHLSVLTASGEAVSMTFTVNGNYGSGVVTEKYGIVLNNEMDDFTTTPGKPNIYGLIQGEGNTVAAGKRPLSSMSPTLIEKNSKIIGAVGAPGGPRIISAVYQTLYRLLQNNYDVDTAIQTPRVHHQFLPNILYVDRNRFSPDVLKALEKKSHKIEESWHARAFAVFNKNGVLEAAYDSRGEGAAGGF
jgi:gamma-glutamyltranspeptidase/glutathione hydrolase